jgi:murein DD-endopeptidase MepM/ murein hydrolase activator NlpD
VVVVLAFADAKRDFDSCFNANAMKNRRFFLMILSVLIGSALAGCQQEASAAFEASPIETRDPTATATSQSPSRSSKVFAQAEPVGESTPVPISLPTPIPSTDPNWRPPPYPEPWAIRAEDHFLLARPIASDEVNWPLPWYRYGSTNFGDRSVHTGVDIGASRGAIVHAAGPGEVLWAGYGLYRGQYDPEDPYGLAVAIRHDFGYKNQRLWTVYAHMDSILVWEGQRLETGDALGTVGDTGHAEGHHLHFEVRLGENRYFSTRNPELWIVPNEGWGVLAGRVMNSWGKPLPEYELRIRSLVTDRRYIVWTYAQDTIHPDEIYQENFVISDLPAGPYEVTIDFVGRTFIANLYIHPGQTNFMIFNGRHGYTVEPTPTPADMTSPPS